VAVVEMMRDRWEGVPDLALLDGGTWGMRVLPFIETADRLLIVDAIKNGGRPGAFVRLEKDEIPRHLRKKVSPHQIELGEVLAVAELRSTFPAEAVAMGIEPASIELRDGLSDTMSATVPELVRSIEAQLSGWGHRPAPAPPRTAPAPDRAASGASRAEETSHA
jgi:hydrogenase maturation protease